jgi:acyl-CoA synthetase (AMP-forming)/AMP-acid ligase II
MKPRELRMTTNKNVFETFTATAALNPGADALVFADVTISYEQLKNLTLAFATRMAEHSVDSSALVTLQSVDLPVVMAFLLASAKLGARVLQYNDGIPLPKELSVTHTFYTVDPTQPAPNNAIEINANWSPALTPVGVREVDTQDRQGPWLYLYTSGTTGNPKFVALTQQMVVERSEAVADDFKAGQTRFASLIPCDTRPFISRALGALLNGAIIVGGHDIDFWRLSGVTMVSGSVGQMVPFFKDLQVSPRFQVAEVLGSKPLASDIRLLLNSFETVQDVIGASEANKVFANISTLQPDGTVKTIGAKRDTEIMIIDADGKPVSDGQSGTLRLKNNYLVQSYVGDEEATKLAFRDGWFYPGDIASWGSDGTLLIKNRDDNVLNIRGLKINALAIDQILKSVDGISDAICFKNPKSSAIDELFAFIVFRESANRLQATESARFLCREKLGDAMVPRIIREVAGIPRRADGSPDRKACADIILRMQ